MAGLLGLAVVAYLALLVVNRNDEAPSADARRLESVAADRPMLPEAGNGHALLAVLAAGHADRLAARTDAVRGLAGACVVPADCEAALAAAPGALAAWQASEAALLQHYGDMLAAGGWQEAVPEGPNAPFPDFSGVRDGQVLYLLGVRDAARAGDADVVRDALERDLAFWRNVMAGSRTLVTRMVAVDAVQRHFQLAQFALRALPAAAAGEAVPASWSRPLTDTERSLAGPLAGEWHMLRGGLLAVAAGAEEGGDDWMSALARPLFQPQATLNRAAATLAGLDDISGQPYAELARSIRAQPGAGDAPDLRFTAYNPIGTVLASSQALSVPMYADYIARSADIEGVRRAALLVATLRAQGVRPGGVPEALRDAGLRDPYDGEAFGWDPAAGAVVFDGLASAPRGSYALAL